MSNYRYRLVNQQASSDKYGVCEVCHKPVSEVWSQYEEQEYKPGQFTQHNCRSYFGHKECLETMQR